MYISKSFLLKKLSAHGYIHILVKLTRSLTPFLTKVAVLPCSFDPEILPLVYKNDVAEHDECD
jgi:hypothetical protein